MINLLRKYRSSNPGVKFKAPRFEDFFDRDIVVRRLDRQSRVVLSKIGAYIRTIARNSMKAPGKRAKGPQRTSTPGNPPKAHTFLLRGKKGRRYGVQFSYDASKRSVIVGPNLIVSRRTTRFDPLTNRIVTVKNDRTVPATLEVGGKVTFIGNKSTTKKFIQPRPYMKPAFKKSLAATTLRQFWKQVRL